MSLKIRETKSGEITVGYCTGRITQGQDSVAFRDFARGVLAGGTNKLILEMSGVQYIDSTGMGELCSAWTVFRNAGGICLVASPSQKVHSVLKITKFDKVFTVVSSVDEGVAILHPAHGDEDHAST